MERTTTSWNTCFISFCSLLLCICLGPYFFCTRSVKSFDQLNLSTSPFWHPHKTSKLLIDPSIIIFFLWKNSRMLGIKPRLAGWEAWMLPLCFAETPRSFCSVTCWDVEAILVDDGLVCGGRQGHPEALRSTGEVGVVVALNVENQLQPILRMMRHN